MLINFLGRMIQVFICFARVSVLTLCFAYENKKKNTIQNSILQQKYWPGCPNDPESRISYHQKLFNAGLSIQTGNMSQCSGCWRHLCVRDRAKPDDGTEQLADRTGSGRRGVGLVALTNHAGLARLAECMGFPFVDVYHYYLSHCLLTTLGHFQILLLFF